MTGWVDIQQHLVRKYDLIAEIEAETITFTRLGGYNARPYSFELDILNGLSAKSLKGVLRWWSRAAVVGALGGTIDYAEANKYLKQIYGGVRRREGEKTTASKIQLTVETIFPQSSEQRAKDAQNIHQKHHESRDQLPPRMRLLLLAGGQRDKEERKTLETKNIKFKIQLLGERNPRLCNFVMASLLMTLILGGVGSMTRRGFGSLKPSSIRLGEDINWDTHLEDICNKLTSERFDANSLTDLLNDLRDKTIQYAKTCFKINYSQPGLSIPLVPSLHNLELRVLSCRNPNLSDLGEVFLRNTWRREKFLGHTWVLGLPRNMKNTGYFDERKRLRRISSIGLRIFSIHDSTFVILYGFLSHDWPERIKHKGRRQHEIIEKKYKLKETYKNAFQTIKSLVEKRCQSQAK